VDPARKIRIGNKLYFGEDVSLVAEVIDNTTSRGRTLRFLFDGDHDTFKEVLYSMGETPLPRSVMRPAPAEVLQSYKETIWGKDKASGVDDAEAHDFMVKMDAERYQTIFARNEGAVVAPTSALHFSRELMKRMEIKDINTAFLTLHASLGNFRDIDVEDLTKHKMDSEQLIIPEETCKIINTTQDNKKRICAIGTTVMRALETAVCTEGHVKAFDGWTNKFIFPPYDFTVASSMVANLYFPYSQLLMMVAAFGGYDYVMNAYNVAVKEGYQFGTYGDAMLII
jgi:S-adenosylmethionine:tRNA ribosyltransferase-isomerase